MGGTAVIYFFSGTGNSEWAARRLAELTHDEALDIKSLPSDGEVAPSAGRDGAVGLVFPVYAWLPPGIVLRFMRRLRVPQGAFCYAVCTCGDEAGRAMRRLNAAFPLNSAYSLVMPNNYVIGFDVDAPEHARQKIAAAAERLPAIAADVMAKKAVVDVREGGFPRVKTSVAGPLFNAFARGTKPFFAEQTCTGCGLCARGCPVSAIRLVNGRPEWTLRRCEMCLSCLNRCPARAIQYGAATRGKGRYYFIGRGD